MQVEKQFNDLTVLLDGEATSELVTIGSWEEESQYETRWVNYPVIVDVHNNYYDVTLTKDEEKEILDSLDINDFVS